MLSILLSIGDPRSVTGWTCAKRLEAVFLDVLGAWRLVGTWSDDDRVRAEPFEAMELALADLWADVEA